MFVPSFENSNQMKLVQISSNWFKLVQIGSKKINNEKDHDESDLLFG